MNDDQPAGVPADPPAGEAPVSPPEETAAKDPEPGYARICVSMYLDDLARLDAMVAELKARGVLRANRSALIRYALASVDLAKVTRSL